MRVTRSLLPDMVKRNAGHIVNISSINAVRIVPDMAAYSASKAGVHMFTETLRGELAETAIRVTEMQPGLTRTNIILTRYRGDRAEGKGLFRPVQDGARSGRYRQIDRVRVGPAAACSDCGDDDSARKSLLNQCRYQGGRQWKNAAELQSTLRIEDVPTVRSMVAQKLREAIMSGTLKPGQRLVERELCEMTGVSRPSIREALRLLEADGLVNTVPHRGPVVSTISLEEAKQLYAARAVLEGFAGRECARLHDPAVVRRIGDALTKLKAAFAEGDLTDGARGQDGISMPR